MQSSVKTKINRLRYYGNKYKNDEKLYKQFYKDLQMYNRLASKEQIASERFLFPCLYDNTTNTNLDPTYFYQDAWAFEKITSYKPVKHYDIGSHNKFVALLSKVVNLTMVDIRPLSLPMDSINFIKGSITELPFSDNSIDSLSSLCVIEHIGLGRYGDPLDPFGSEKSLLEVKRVLKSNGMFYLSVPVSNKHIVRFNAGIIFNYHKFKKQLQNDYIITDEKIIADGRLGDVFVPNDSFGTTALFELKKK